MNLSYTHVHFAYTFRIIQLYLGVSGVSDAEVQGGEEYDEEEQIFDVGDSTEREGDRQVIGSASHQNDRSPIPFNFDDHDEEDNLDDDEDEDGDQNDRQVRSLYGNCLA